MTTLRPKQASRG